MTINDAWAFLQHCMPALAFLGTVALLFLGTKFVRHGRCEAHRAGLQAGCDDHEERIVALEGRQTEAINKLKVSMAQLQGKQDALAVEIRGVKDLVERVEEQQRMLVKSLLGGA